MYCRLAAREISALKPALDAAGVRLIGVGVEPLGVEDFIAGGFFDGELYIDMNKGSYKAMDFSRMSKGGLFGAVMSKSARAFQKRAKALKVDGDKKGDWYQYGGAIVVDENGKDLFVFKQKEAPEHPENEDIMKALGMDTSVVKHAEDLGPVVCKV